MKMTRISLITLFATSVSLLDWSADAVERRHIRVEDEIEMRTPHKVMISPDGKWVVYALSAPSLKDNHDGYPYYSSGIFPKLCVVSAEVTAALPHELVINEPYSVVTWMPDSERVVILVDGKGGQQLRTVNPKTQRQAVLLTSESLGENVRLHGAEVGSEHPAVRFSPDGRQMGFLASETKPLAPRVKELHALQVPHPDWRVDDPGPQSVTRLWVMDLASGKARAVTDSTLNVATFDWSPDGRKFALTANYASELSEAAWGMVGGDIFVVDADGKRLRALVQLQGMDRDPVWSSNGRQIAFCTQQGKENWLVGCTTLGLIDVNEDDAGSLRFIGKEMERVAGDNLGRPQWVPNEESLHVVTHSKMGKHLFKINVDGRIVERITPREDRYYDQFSYSRDGRRVAFTIEGVGVPPDVYVSSRKVISPRLLTQLNPEWNDLGVPTTEVRHWRSSDGRWTIYGLLLKPSYYRPGLSYPMLVSNVGGPGMVRLITVPDRQHYLLSLVESGYVVLMPNTRGRGGYGVDFAHAIRDERSYTLNQVKDVLSGVDAMLGEGVADASKLGIVGFSYGMTLTLQTIIGSDRFKAAVVGGGTDSYLMHLFKAPVSLWPFYRDMWGAPNPFDRQNIDRAFEQTALFFLDRIKTPVLLQSGEKDLYLNKQPLFSGLLHFGIPVEHVVYPRQGHGWHEPVMQQESYRRISSWLDYWLRNKPYRDSKRQQAYDIWKASRGKNDFEWFK